MPCSLANNLLSTKLILAGLKAHQDKIAEWGFDQGLLAELEEIYQDAISLNNDQQAYLSRFKEKTSALNKKKRPW